MKTERFTHINGHGQEATKKHYMSVQNFRLQSDTPEFVVLLAEAYGGCFTHYVKKIGSQYCSGDNCKVPGHGIDRTWKGYCPALRLMRAEKPWYAPVCLEISENLELDMRNVFRRGQTWELYRERPGDKFSPISGRLHDDPPPLNLMKPFDIIPCLRALYHRDVIDLRHPSPIPPRVYIEETPAVLPQALTPNGNQETFQIPEGFKSHREWWEKVGREAARQKKSPSSKN